MAARGRDITQKEFRVWLAENNVDSYAFSNWLRRHNPGKLWFQCNTEQNRAAYLEHGRLEQNPIPEDAAYEEFRASLFLSQARL